MRIQEEKNYAASYYPLVNGLIRFIDDPYNVVGVPRRKATRDAINGIVKLSSTP